MRILQLISSTGFYGAEKMILELSRGLAAAGHDVIIANIASGAGRRAKLLELAAGAGISSHEIPCGGRFDPRAALRLRRFVKSNGVQIVHSHGYKADFYAGLARLGSRMKLVATCHNWPGTSTTTRCYRWLDKIVIRGFDRVAVVSRRLLGEISGSLATPSRVTLIANGIEAHVPAREKREAAKAALGISPEARVIGTLGRLSPEKGYDILLKALPGVFRRFPAAVCVMAGDGPGRAGLEAAARGLGIAERVRFTGNRDDVPDLLGMYDVFVQPSLTEGLPMALLEAMGAEKPVVATAVGEVPAVVTQETGILVKAGSAEALEKALSRLLADEGEARSMAKLAGERIRREYSLGRMTNDYVELYNELLGVR